MLFTVLLGVSALTLYNPTGAAQLPESTPGSLAEGSKGENSGNTAGAESGAETGAENGAEAEKVQSTSSADTDKVGASNTDSAVRKKDQLKPSVTTTTHVKQDEKGHVALNVGNGEDTRPDKMKVTTTINTPDDAAHPYTETNHETVVSKPGPNGELTVKHNTATGYAPEDATQHNVKVKVAKDVPPEKMGNPDFTQHTDVHAAREAGVHISHGPAQPASERLKSGAEPLANLPSSDTHVDTTGEKAGAAQVTGAAAPSADAAEPHA